MEEQEQQEIMKQIRKRDGWYYCFVIGQWLMIVAVVLLCFYVAAQAETLKTNPCGACEEQGYDCIILHNPYNQGEENLAPQGYNFEHLKK